MRLKLIKWLIIPFACILLMSHNTYAEFIVNGRYADVVMFGDAYFCTDASLPNSVNMNSGKCDSQNNKYWRHTGNMRIESGSSTINWAFGGIVLSSGANSLAPGYLTIPIYIVSTQQNIDLANVTGFMATPNQDSNHYFRTVESRYEQLSESSGRVVVTLYHDWTIPANKDIFLCSNSQNGVNATNNPYALNAVWSRGVLGFGVIVGNGINFAVVDNGSSEGSSYDDTEVLQSLYAIYQKLDQISSNSAAAGVDEINEAIETENENISSQSPQTITQSGGSGENSQTQSLMSGIGSFLSAITNLQATDCNVDLAFPQFAGGTQRVNICQNKEYTGNIVSIGGSIILVLFYLPVAFMLVSKIYSEIRSFTNG